MSLYIRETHINLDKGYRYYDSDVYEVREHTKGELFRELQREYGRCTGKVYIDRLNGKSRAIGWVFEKKVEYEGGRYGQKGEYYTREVWVRIHKRMPKVENKYYY